MKILKSLLIVGVAAFVVTSTVCNVFAEERDSQQKSNNKVSGFTIRNTGQFIEVDDFNSDNSSRQNQSSGICSSGDFSVTSAFGGPGIDIIVLNEWAKLLNVVPTATIKWIFEINDNPFNNIPKLPSNEQLLIRFGDDSTITDDPDNDNQVIVSVPAFSAENPHEIVFKTFDGSGSPRYLIRGMNTEHLLVLLDVELIKFADIPILLTREILNRSFVRIESS